MNENTFIDSFDIFFVETQLGKKTLEKYCLDARVWVRKPVYRSLKWPEYATAFPFNTD